MDKLRIISYSSEPFTGRAEAGRLLAAQLADLRGANPVILGIPRGGVVVAAVLAEELDGEMDIILSHKIGAPGNSELAIGAVSEGGESYIDHNLTGRVGASQSYITGESVRVMAEITQRSRQYRLVRPKVPLGGRTVIITDDGVATGSTAMAAIWAVRQEAPQRLIVALPVGPPDTLARLSEQADEVVCLQAPPYFHAVGQFYASFDQTSDEEVLELLRQRQRSVGT